MSPAQIFANWKMHGSVLWVEAWADSFLAAELAEDPRLQAVVCPPFVYLSALSQRLSNTSVGLGAQNLSAAEQGARTGEISAPMLADLGCGYVLIGHSERRTFHAESDSSVAEKMRVALKYNLRPVLCVGEALSQREAGETETHIIAQLRSGLSFLEPAEASQALVAYEPVWAIGSGRAAQPADAQQVHALIRAQLTQQFGGQIAAEIAILYGGSVSQDNIAALIAENDVDGALVGGASLDAQNFVEICTLAAQGTS